jgi:anti-anti-sigma factor
MTQGENQATAECGAGIEILGMPAELDLTTSDGVVEQGYAAIDRSARLLLLDLTGLSFCDARGLTAFVRIANYADAAGCRFALIAPQPPVAKILRISRLNSRMPVFATIDGARGLLTAMTAFSGGRECADRWEGAERAHRAWPGASPARPRRDHWRASITGE